MSVAAQVVHVMVHFSTTRLRSCAIKCFASTPASVYCAALNPALQPGRCPRNQRSGERSCFAPLLLLSCNKRQIFQDSSTVMFNYTASHTHFVLAAGFLPDRTCFETAFCLPAASSSSFTLVGFFFFSASFLDLK